jgi:hypothetical protein
MSVSVRVLVTWHAKCIVCAAVHNNLWFVRFFEIFPHYLIKDMIVGEKVIGCEIHILIFCKTFV